MVSQTIDTVLYFYFGLESYEQTAVSYFKAATSSPLSCIMAIFFVLLVSPILEEFLFRGLLQNWIREHLNTKAAIFLSSLFFALLHMNPSQGIGNISLFFSLAIFGGFLGFIYERQKSLSASIILHMTFNSISALRLLFFPES